MSRTELSVQYIRVLLSSVPSYPHPKFFVGYLNELRDLTNFREQKTEICNLVVPCEIDLEIFKFQTFGVRFLAVVS